MASRSRRPGTSGTRFASGSRNGDGAGLGPKRMTVRTIRPATARGTIDAPPSKSYTHRALVLAALTADPDILVEHPLRSDDIRATVRGLRAMGVRITSHGNALLVRTAPAIALEPATVDCGESGTTLRFLLAVAALGTAPIRFLGTGRLPRRPVRAITDPLVSMGARVEFARRDRSLPVTVTGPIRAGRVRVESSESSQPTSALLLIASAIAGTTRIEQRGAAVSRPYVEATLAALRRFGIQVRTARDRHEVAGPQRARIRRFRVPGDASSAAYLWAAAAATGGLVRVRGIDPELPQADLRVLDWLRRQGCSVSHTRGGITVKGRLRRGAEVDLTDAPDLYPLLAVLAAITPGGSSRLTGAPHLALKESDRRTESLRLALGLGADARLTRSGLEVRGRGSPTPVRMESLTDHRLVMSAAIGGLAATGPSRLGDAGAVRKSFPGFWTSLASLTR
jgi:3-phosphoshikimate 1-carboxyvinyltransferase